MTAVKQDLRLSDYIRSIPNYPQPGILFRDITPLLASAAAFRQAVCQMAEHYADRRIDLVAAFDARGFVFAGPLAIELGVGLIPLQKPERLPVETHAFHYEIEYSPDTLDVYRSGLNPGHKILMVDDLLASGHSVEVCCQMVERAGATVVGCGFLIELKKLGGAARIAPRESFSLIKYE